MACFFSLLSSRSAYRRLLPKPTRAYTGPDVKLAISSKRREIRSVLVVNTIVLGVAISPVSILEASGNYVAETLLNTIYIRANFLGVTSSRDLRARRRRKSCIIGVRRSPKVDAR